jgi:hypothetical protein
VEVEGIKAGVKVCINLKSQKIIFDGDTKLIILIDFPSTINKVSAWHPERSLEWTEGTIKTIKRVHSQHLKRQQIK